MKTLLRILVALAGILFVVLGLRWAVDPSGAAASVGMTLMDGVGLSSQIADVGAFFLSGGIMILLGLITSKASWFQAAALMVALAAVYRVLAWLVHDAALTPDMIVVEVVLTGLMLLAASKLTQEK
jgi:hypothetical protein